MLKITPLPHRHLTVSGLAAMRGERLVFADVGFELSSGQAALLRGRNGAGKSTLLLCLAEVLRPSAGTITWTGRDPEARSVEDLLLAGHLPAVKSGLSVHENLIFWARLNGDDVDRVPAALEAAGLSELDHIGAGQLSAGQVRRLSLARLLISDRPVWLLDEPTSALDAQGDAWVGTMIDRHLDRGGIVLAATHLDLALRDAGRVKTITLVPPSLEFEAQ